MVVIPPCSHEFLYLLPSIKNLLHKAFVCLRVSLAVKPRGQEPYFIHLLYSVSGIWYIFFLCWSLTSTSWLMSISASCQVSLTHPDIQCCPVTVQKHPSYLHLAWLDCPLSLTTSKSLPSPHLLLLPFMPSAVYSLRLLMPVDLHDYLVNYNKMWWLLGLRL